MLDVNLSEDNVSDMLDVNLSEHMFLKCLILTYQLARGNVFGMLELLANQRTCFCYA